MALWEQLADEVVSAGSAAEATPPPEVPAEPGTWSTLSFYSTVGGAAVTPDGRTILLGDEFGVVHFVPWTRDALLERAATVAGQNFSAEAFVKIRKTS